MVSFDMNQTLEKARHAVSVAMRFSLDMYSKNQSIAKEDKSPVSLADIGCQLLIQSHLKGCLLAGWIAEEDVESFKSLKKSVSLAQWEFFWGLLGSYCDIKMEQDAIDLLRGSGEPHTLYWVLDPIDGTMGYLRGDQYAICISLLEASSREILFGVIGCPRLDPHGGVVFHALKGDGQVLRHIKTEEPCRVSQYTEQDRLIYCESVPSTGHARHDIWSKIKAILHLNSTSAIQVDSQAKYCLVASGKAHVYLRWPLDEKYIEKIWDHAAGALLVQEAGGKVTDLNGNPLIFDAYAPGGLLNYNHGILATCGEPLHSRIVEALRSISNE